MAPPLASPLASTDWQYVTKGSLDDFDAADWQIINRQRAPYMAAQQSRQVLRMLTVSRDDPTFGYAVNNYRHCLQSATLAMEAGLDEETIVVALLHDVGFITCPDTHGEFAAALLGPYISAANRWMLRHHALFQNHHVQGYPGLDRNARERWRDHPHFQWTAEFVDKYDQGAIRVEFTQAPIKEFEPMVQRLFARTPRLERSATE
jgi:predicted HD phosphohydrolase